MSLKTVILLTILNSVAWGQYTPLTPSETYTNSHIVNSADPGLFQVFWKRIGTDEIQFEVHCKTLGWVGFGISPAGGMTGADITKFWIRDGLIFLFDTYATGNSSPRTDTIQNVSWLGGAEVNDYTIVKFKRKLVTGDTQHDINIINGNQIFIFAFSTTDPVTGDGDWSYHGRNNRFQATLNLLAAGSGRY